MLEAAVLAIAAATGCGALDRRAALAPETLAPPSAAAPWRPPDALRAEGTPPPVAGLPPEADPARRWTLAELIDLALASNPGTRVAWAEVRAAAARFGAAQAGWLPVLGLVGRGGWSQVVNATAAGREEVRSAELDAGLELAWLLTDFGRREAERARARGALAEAGFRFTRAQQTVAFEVQRAFFALAARRAGVDAAAATLAAARAVVGQAEAREVRGLATRADVLLARQEHARAAFALEDARGRAEDAWGALAEAVGISPAVRLTVDDPAGASSPGELEAAVEAVMDAALAVRPDLAARVAALRAREAETRRARAERWPRVGLTGHAGGVARRYRAGPPMRSFDDADPEYGAFLGLEWRLFDGFERENAVRAADARRDAAAAERDALVLRALREVWTAWVDARTARRKLDYAEALLAAAEQSWAAADAAYGAGLGTLIDLLTAERDLAAARTVRIETRAAYRTAAAALAFAAGAPLAP